MIGSPAQHHFSRSVEVTPLVGRTEPRAVSMTITPESWRRVAGPAATSPGRTEVGSYRPRWRGKGELMSSGYLGV
jgi:hypothetical protein